MSGNRRNPQPLSAARLQEMALAYVARFATTQAKLEAYLVRKLRERGWAGEGAPPVSAIAARMVAAGYIDDAVYARMKAGSLLRRGFGGRRVGEALAAAGVAGELRDEVSPDEASARKAALALARRRRLGPYGAPPADRGQREKQVATLLRAGHRLDIARRIVDFASLDEAEEWAESADG